MNESRKFFLKVKFQPINVERIIKTEKSPFGKHHSSNHRREESSMNAKITE